MEVLFDLTNPLGSAVPVSIAVSTNNGATYDLPATSFVPASGSAFVPGNNRMFVWDAGADWNGRVSSQVRFRVAVAGGLAAESPAVEVDTRDGQSSEPGEIVRPQVVDVVSQYCDRQRHVYFLEGVSLEQTFRVVANWNGKTPGEILFKGPRGTHKVPADRLTRTYNVGRDFRAGDRLWVVLEAGDGTRSAPYPVNFEVIESPPGLSPGGVAAVASEDSQALRYKRLPKVRADFLREDRGSIPTADGRPIPGMSGNPLKFNLALALSVEVGGDGAARFEDRLELGLPEQWNILNASPSIRGLAALNYQYTGNGWKISHGNLGVGGKLRWETPPFPISVPFLPALYGQLEFDFLATAQGKIVANFAPF